MTKRQRSIHGAHRTWHVIRVATCMLMSACSSDTLSRTRPTAPDVPRYSNGENTSGDVATSVKLRDPSTQVVEFTDSTDWQYDYEFASGLAQDSTPVPAYSSHTVDMHWPRVMHRVASLDSTDGIPTTGSIQYSSQDSLGAVTTIVLSATTPPGTPALPCLDGVCPVRKVTWKDSISGRLLMEASYDYEYDATEVAYHVKKKIETWYDDSARVMAVITSNVDLPSFAAAPAEPAHFELDRSQAFAARTLLAPARAIGALVAPQVAFAQGLNPCDVYKKLAWSYRRHAAQMIVDAVVHMDSAAWTHAMNDLACASSAMQQ